jgi:hypothetical protein
MTGIKRLFSTLEYMPLIASVEQWREVLKHRSLLDVIDIWLVCISDLPTPFRSKNDGSRQLEFR